MWEDNNISIKEKFMYNDSIYKKLRKKENIKKLKKLLFSFALFIISIIPILLLFMSDDNTNIPITYILIITAVLVTIPILCFLLLSYHAIMFITQLSDKELFFDRCYVITDENEFLSLKFANSYLMLKSDVVNNGVLDDLVRYLILKNSIEKEYEKVKSVEKSAALDDLISCLKIVNVYSVKDDYDCIEVLCDCIELTTNKVLKKKKVYVYKCFDNFDRMKLFLEEMITKTKNEIEEPEVKKAGLIEINSIFKNKYSFLEPLVLAFVGGLLNFSKDHEISIQSIFFFLVIGISFLIIDFYEMLKYKKRFETPDLHFTLEKRVRNDKISLCIYGIIVIIYLVFISDNIILDISIIVICISFFFLVYKQFEKAFEQNR